MEALENTWLDYDPWQSMLTIMRVFMALRAENQKGIKREQWQRVTRNSVTNLELAFHVHLKTTYFNVVK